MAPNRLASTRIGAMGVRLRISDSVVYVGGIKRVTGRTYSEEGVSGAGVPTVWDISLVCWRGLGDDEWHIEAAEIARANISYYETKLVAAGRELQTGVEGQAVVSNAFVAGTTGIGVDLRVGVGD